MYESSSSKFFTLVFVFSNQYTVPKVCACGFFNLNYEKYVHTICNEFSCAIHFRDTVDVFIFGCCVIFLFKK